MKSYILGVVSQLWCLIFVLQVGQCSEEKCLKDIKDTGICVENLVKCDDWNGCQDRHVPTMKFKITNTHIESQALAVSALKVDKSVIHLELEIKTFLTVLLYLMNCMIIILHLRIQVLTSNKKYTVNKHEKIILEERKWTFCTEGCKRRGETFENLKEVKSFYTDVDAGNGGLKKCHKFEGHHEDKEESLNDHMIPEIISEEANVEQCRDSQAGKEFYDKVELMEHSGNKLFMDDNHTGEYCRLQVDSRREICPLDFQFLDIDVEEDTGDGEETLLKFTDVETDTCKQVDPNNSSKPDSDTLDMIRYSQSVKVLGRQKNGYEGQFEMTNKNLICINSYGETYIQDPVQCTDSCEEGYLISMKNSLSVSGKVMYSDHMSDVKGQSQVVPESSKFILAYASICSDVAEAESKYKEPLMKTHIGLDKARVGDCTSNICKGVCSTKDTVLIASPKTNLADNEEDMSTEAFFRNNKKSNNEVCDESLDSFGVSIPCISQRWFQFKCHHSSSLYEEYGKENQNDSSFVETDCSCSIAVGSNYDGSKYFSMHDNERSNCPEKPKLSFEDSLHCGSQNTEKIWCSPVDHTPNEEKSKKTKQKESEGMKSVLHGSFLRWYSMHHWHSLIPDSRQQSKKKKRKQYHASVSSYKKKIVKHFFKKYNKKHLRNIVTWRGSYQRNQQFLNTVTTFPTSGKITGGQLSGVDCNEQGAQSSDAEAAAASVAAAAANVILPAHGDEEMETDKEDNRDSSLLVDSSSSQISSLSNFFSSVISGSLSSSDEEMIYEWKRLQSFENFPLRCPVSPLHLARDGWYYANDGDTVICFSCQAMHSGWTYGSNTQSFHQPTCSFMLGGSTNVPIHGSGNIKSGGCGGRTLVSNGADRQQTSVRQPEMISSDRQSQVIAQTSSASEHLLQQHTQEQLSQHEHGFVPGRSHYQESTGVQQQQQGSVQQQHPTIQQQDTSLQRQNTAIHQNASIHQNAAIHQNMPINVYMTMHQNTAVQQQASRPADTNSTNTAQTAISQSSGRAISTFDMNNQSTVRNMSASPSPRLQPNVSSSPVGINFEKPRYPAFAILSTRISTFQEWSAKGFSQTPREMASAGFYYAGYGDYVRCFFCGGGLRNWETGDDPWVEHAKWYSKCTFVRQNKGDRFVEDILLRERDRGPEGDLARERQTSNTPDSSKNEMESEAVLSIKEMGYTPDQIKKALSVMKKRLGAGRHTVTAQDILEVIFEIVEQERAEQRDENSAVKQRQAFNSSSNAVASQPASKSRTEKKSSNSDKGGKKNSLEKKENSIGDKGKKKSSLEKKENSKENPAEDRTESGSSTLTQEELRSLKEENTHLKEQIMCKICMDNNVSVAFLPCGHLACCHECAPAMRKCPICRVFVKGVVKTYLA